MNEPSDISKSPRIFSQVSEQQASMSDHIREAEKLRDTKAKERKELRSLSIEDYIALQRYGNVNPSPTSKK